MLQGWAKSVTVEEQLQLLHQCEEEKTPENLNEEKKQEPSSDRVDNERENTERKGSTQGQSGMNQGSGIETKKRDGKDCQESHQNVSTVNLGSSMETLSDSTHSIPRLPTTKTREEREKKNQRESKEKQKRKEKLSKERVTGKTGTKSAKGTPGSKSKKCVEEVPVEKVSDSDGPVCSTPVEENRNRNDLNEDKSLDKNWKQGSETQNCVQNIEVKIKNVAEDCLSVRSTESESLLYSVDKSMDLPTNIDVDVSCLKVMMSHVVSPSDFYVHLVSKVSAQTLDQMHISLNKTMEQMSKKQLQKMSKSYKPSISDLCCVLFSEDNQYYRGLVMGVELVSPTKGSGNNVTNLENVGKVSVFYLDFGNSEVVPKRRVFPLPQQYANLPGLALHVSLAYIQPSVVRGSPKKDAKWTDEATEKFVSVTGFDSALNMIIVDGSIQMMFEK